MITISPAAKAQLNHLWTRHSPLSNQESIPSLRLFVRGAGCSGLKYGFQLDRAAPGDSDTAIDCGGEHLSVLIDPISLYYLDKATLDFEESLQSSGFVIKNPHVRTSCACGSSFQI